MPKPSLLLLIVTALAYAAFTDATITGYSNTLSSNIASATGVTSTYTFTPESGVAKAFRSIEITNQGFSQAAAVLTASCSNLISIPTAAISTGAGGSQTGSFTFKTSTDLVIDDVITLAFPTGLLLAVATETSCEFVPALANPSVTSGTTADSIKITVKSALTAGSLKVTCSGLTFAAKEAVLATTTGGLSIKTTKDTETAHISTPAVGAVTVVAASALTMSRVIGASQTASVTFTTSTALPVGGKITLSFPGGLVASVVSGTTFCELSSPKLAAVSSASFAADAVTITLASIVNAGEVTVTCTGLTLAAKDATTAGLTVKTSLDTIAATIATPAIGAVTAIAESALRLTGAAGSSQTATVSFSTSTGLPTGGQITLTFPIALIASVTPATTFCAVTSVASTASFASGVVILTVGATLSAGPVIVTCSGLNLAPTAEVKASVNTGLKIHTSKDIIPVFVDVRDVGVVKANTASALILSKEVGATGTASITFTTSTAFAASAGNTITLSFPSGHVTANAENKCTISSPQTKSTSAYTTNTITITVDATATLSAGKVTVTCTGLTLAAKVGVINVNSAPASAGLQISTSADTIGAFVDVPAVGAVTVDAGTVLTMSNAVSTAGTATVKFTTSTPLVATDTVVITFGAILTAGTGCSISSPTAAGVAAFAAGAITITLSTGATLAAGPVTVTCTGLTLAAGAAVAAGTIAAPAGLIIATSKDTVKAFANTPAVGAITVNAGTVLTMSNAVSTAGTATVKFTTSTPLVATDTVVITFGAILTAGTGCAISSPTAAGVAAFAAGAITITLDTGVTLAAGPVTVTCTGLTLAAGAAVAAGTIAAPAGLIIATSKDTVKAFANTPAVGAITVDAGTVLTMSNAVSTAGTATVKFTTSTPLVATDTVVITFGAILTAGTGCAISSPTAAGVAGFAAGAITITLDTGVTLAAGPVTVTCTGLTLAAGAAVAAGTIAAPAGLIIATSKDTVKAFANTPAVGAVTVDLLKSSSSPMKATFELKKVKLTSEKDVWTETSTPSVTCTVSPFTNAPLVSTSAEATVSVTTLNSAGVAVSTADTAQTFPASFAAPIARSLYLPKATGSSFGVASLIAAITVLLLACL
jgi:hypothetical protein